MEKEQTKQLNIKPLSKEEFVKYIDRIQEVSDKNEKFEAAGRECFEDFLWFPNDLQTELIKLLSRIMNDDTELIDYFVYELDFGREWEPGYVTEKDGTDIKLANASDLYDELVRNW